MTKARLSRKDPSSNINQHQRTQKGKGIRISHVAITRLAESGVIGNHSSSVIIRHGRAAQHTPSSAIPLDSIAIQAMNVKMEGQSTP